MSARRRGPAVARAAIAVAALWASGCDEPLAAPIAAAHPEIDDGAGGTLHLGSLGDVRTLDPAVTADALAAEAMELLFAGLVDFDERGEVRPDLAERVDRSPDGLAYTFTLREGVRFHDGEELTAADVKRSVERALHPSTPDPFASYFEGIDGYDAFAAKRDEHLRGVEVAGRYVVRFRLKAPDATFPSLLALHALRPVCRSAGDRYADAWPPCGAGPFRLEGGGWDRGRSLTLRRHPGYFRPGLPRLDAVTFTYRMNVATERFQFEDGDLDVVRDLTQDATQRLLRDPRWKELGAYGADTAAYGENMNVELAPFDNVEVRRAVAAAIDRDHYRLLRATNVLPSGHFVPGDVAGSSRAAPGQTYDLAAALEHMRRAGYPYDPATGRGGYPYAIEYTTSRQAYSEYTAQVLQQDLARIGLRLELKIVSFATYLATTHRRGRSPMSNQGWNEDFPDAADFYESVFASRSINDEDSNNSSFYASPRFDEVVSRAHAELDPPARQRLYDEADAILRDDAPWAFTHGFRWYAVHQPYVRGLRVHPVWQEDVTRAWIDRAASEVARRAGVLAPSALGAIFGFGARATPRPSAGPAPFARSTTGSSDGAEASPGAASGDRGRAPRGLRP